MTHVRSAGTGTMQHTKRLKTFPFGRATSACCRVPPLSRLLALVPGHLEPVKHSCVVSFDTRLRRTGILFSRR